MTDGHPSRRAVLAGSVALASALAGCEGQSNGETPTDGTATGPTDESSRPPTDGSTPGDGVDGLELRATEVASGFTAPVAMVAPGPDELLVADQVGVIYRVVDDDLRDEPYLDLRDRIVDVSGYSEQGLLGLALHPGYADNGRVFVRYSAPSREGTPSTYSHTFVLAEFDADPGSGVADPDSERTILEIPQPQANHNAGPIAFGPDGYLYVTTGDGGDANDQGPGHVDDWYDAVSGGNGQDVTENLLGAVLRIDVDSETSETSQDGGGEAADEESEDTPYAIPEDNPLVGRDGADEHYAWGLRNPFGISFGPDGRGYVVDVGQDRFEEVNVLERGANYGWNVREGYECFQESQCPEVAPNGDPLVDPIVAYPHSDADVSGIAVIGGYVYDGDAIPALRGAYVFGDYQTGGRLFVATEASAGWDVRSVPVEGDMGGALFGMGLDADGELLVASNEHGQVRGDTGVVARLERA